jgi:FtsP/CotA-like multicopper oxidase with cupredoxin domain
MAGAQSRRLPRALVTMCAVNALVAIGLGATPAHAAAAQQHPAALKPAAQPAVAAAGRLTPTGCAPGAVATDVTCDLFAKVGTTTIVGASIPIWGFASVSTAPALTPGPSLVVNQGDNVTVTLHNNVPGEHMSLSFPSQPGAPFAGGDDVTGVPTGGTVSYSFTAGSAGTFMYEAGHTSNGARQVAMGLAGALVVLPSDGSAYGAQPTGFPSSSYDDDALLVLSEIDPALNHAPTTFDMRDWSPKYRLVNGNAFPETKTISTDQNHKVLVRYVNIGSNAHSMTVLGREQIEVAADGHASHYSTTLATEAIDPGTTLDAIVTMPSGADSKFAIYEPSQHSDNNSAPTADPEQLALGGMIVMLDTNAAPAGTDTVGPVSSHVTVTPKTAGPGDTVTVKADLSDAKTGGSAVMQAEFFIDNPTLAVGFGTPLLATFGTVAVSGASATIDPLVLAGLESGRHTIYVRALDAAATPGNWGVVSSVTFVYAKAGPQTTNVEADANPANGQQGVDLTATGDDRIAGGKVIAAEYFVGAVGDDGTGQAMTLNRQTSVAAMTATIPAAVVLGLGEGTHPVYVHAQDSHGTWGGTNHVDLVVDLNGPAVLSASVGPNPSNGVIGAKGNPGYLMISASIADGPPASGVASLLDDAEAFIDPLTPPAEGSGIQLVAVDGEMDSSTESVYGLIPLTHIRPLLDGPHTVYVRGHDVAGNWGPLFAAPLTVDKMAPVLGPLAVTFTPTAGVPTTATLTAPLTETSPLSVAEYWIGAAVPPVGKGISTTWTVNTSAAVPPVTTVAIDVDLATVPAGNQQFNMRVRDAAGNWSQPVSTVAYVKKNPIFSDNFDSGGLARWSARTGAVSNVNNALQVSFANTPRVASYVTDTTPIGELTYHAKFTFTPVGLTSGNLNALTIFSARDITNRQVFSVQYRLNTVAPGLGPQVRIVLSRNGVLPEVVGNWFTVTAGQTIQVDWAAGSNGSLQLVTNNVLTDTLAGLNSALRVDTVLLGVTTGVGLVTGGTASFDNFVSVRSTF